jgi:hypothetical protein
MLKHNELRLGSWGVRKALMQHYDRDKPNLRDLVRLVAAINTKALISEDRKTGQLVIYTNLKEKDCNLNDELEDMGYD